MTGTIEKRVEALEASQSLSEPVTWIITYVAPGPDAEPCRADVGGRTIHRTDGETGEGFLARVAAEAKLAAKPGCGGVAMVWLRTTSVGSVTT